MSEKNSSTTELQLSARKCAARAVDEYFDAMLESREFFPLDGFMDRAEEQPSLGDAFEAVSEILEAEYERTHGSIKGDKDLVRWDIGLSAGYLIGVQVGLRLRNVGGIR